MDIPCYKGRTHCIRLGHTGTDLEVWLQMVISRKADNK